MSHKKCNNPSCQADNPVEAKFCRKCGKVLVENINTRFQDINTFCREFNMSDHKGRGLGCLFVILMFIFMGSVVASFQDEILFIICSIVVAFITAFFLWGVIPYLDGRRILKCLRRKAFDIEVCKSEYKIFRTIDGKYGLCQIRFLNRKIIILQDYESMGRFSEFAIVCKKGGAWGVYNTQSGLTVPCVYDSIIPISETQLLAKRGNEEVKYNQFCERVVD